MPIADSVRIAAEDPNWFYSSLAQSAAAVVALIGSVLAVRLQNQLATVKGNAAILLADYLEWRTGFINSAHQVAQAIVIQDSALRDITNALSEKVQSVDILIAEYQALAGRRGPIPVSRETLNYHQKVRDTLHGIHDCFQRALVDVDVTRLDHHRLAMEALLGQIPEKGRGMVDSHVRALRRFEPRLRRHGADATIWASVITIVILAVISTFAVLLPLNALAARSSDERLRFIGAFAFGIAAMLMLLLVQVIEVRRGARILVPEESRWEIPSTWPLRD